MPAFCQASLLHRFRNATLIRHSAKSLLWCLTILLLPLSAAQAREVDLAIPDLHQALFVIDGFSIDGWNLLFYCAFITCGGSVIYWFSGASMQAVSTGAYRAVSYIKENMDFNKQKADLKDSINAGGAWDNAKKLVEVDFDEKGTDPLCLGHRRHGGRPV